MARMLGIHASIIRGSIGGNTFFANQFHQILIRQRTSPVDPSTSIQALIRAGMAAGSVAWDGIISTVQDQWDAWAENIFFPGPCGDYTVPGRQLFVAARAYQEYLRDRGELITLVSTAPTVNSLLKITSPKTTAPSVSGTGVNVSVKNSDSESAIVMVQRSVPFMHSRRRFKGPYLSSTAQYLVVGGGASADVDFLTLEAGKAYFFKISGVTSETAPRTSKKFHVRGIASIVV